MPHREDEPASNDLGKLETKHRSLISGSLGLVSGTVDFGLWVASSRGDTKNQKSRKPNQIGPWIGSVFRKIQTKIEPNQDI